MKKGQHFLHVSGSYIHHNTFTATLPLNSIIHF